MRKKRNILSTVILIIILLVGISVMLYPTVSDWWNSRVQSYAIADYDVIVEEIDDTQYEEILEMAHFYNSCLPKVIAPFSNPQAVSDYSSTLNISGTGIMGYITIPSIQVQLPIYHGTSEEVLNVAAGHLQGSSLPVGGESTHCVISAHRGLPSARLFSDLDQLREGDTFTITIMDEILTYEVEEIFIVLPHEMDKLAIIEGEDYVTLMTCTPYGVNSHRLLLRSRRIETVYPHNVKITADAVQVDPMLVVPGICAPLLLALIIIWIFGGKKRKVITPSMVLDEMNSSKKEGD
ncbi:MAG: class C sortase [Ruminococcus sp.]|nr:class C sortase [Ruminococcus sp.]